MGSRRVRFARAGGIAMLVFSAAAAADVPRLDLSLGAWQHDNEGTLSSDNPLLTVPAGTTLDDTQDSYARFGVRLGNAWWAPVVRARYTTVGAAASAFQDDSIYVGPVLVTLDTTTTRTELSFDQFEGLMYFTLGEKIRGELGGGLKRIDGSIDVVSVNTTNTGDTVTRANRELKQNVRVFYGAAYAEPASWLSFGGEAVGGKEAGTDVLDLTFRFMVKPLTGMGLEGGYRRLTVKGENHNNATYDFEFGGPYAGLSFLYGSKDAGLLQPDTDDDGVDDKEDQCPETPAGAPVNEVGCEPDADQDGVPDRVDTCADTPDGAEVDDKGCPKQGNDDSDGDGAPDSQDACPGTAAGIPVDEKGCPQEVLAAAGEGGPDADVDGIPDGRDQCPESPAGTPVDANGCPLGGLPHAAAGPDEDQDGVPDGADRCKRTPRGFKVDASGCLVQQESVLQGITFQVNSSYLMRDSEVLLLEVVDALKADRTSRIVIQGHTCDLGDAKYNKWLSERRANRVLEFLVRHGIDRARLNAVGYGEEQPLVPNDDERMRELNRRTVFKVVP